MNRSSICYTNRKFPFWCPLVWRKSLGSIIKEDMGGIPHQNACLITEKLVTLKCKSPSRWTPPWDSGNSIECYFEVLDLKTESLLKKPDDDRRHSSLKLNLTIKQRKKTSRRKCVWKWVPCWAFLLLQNLIDNL